MPWDCWLEYDDDRILSEAWNAATEEFSEDGPSTTVHQIQGARITLSASYNQKDWTAMQEWISWLALHGIVKLVYSNINQWRDEFIFGESNFGAHQTFF